MEIDINKFMEIMKAALVAASTPNKGDEKNVSEPQLGETPSVPIKKPRGRPKKEVMVKRPTAIEPAIYIEVEDEPEKELPPPPPRRSSYLAPAKGKNFDTTNKTSAKTKEFQAPKGPNKFDVMGFGNLCKNANDGIRYPDYDDRAERRPARNKQKYKCDKCNREFEAYPSEVPQAREMQVIGGEGVSGRESFRPMLYCDNCHGNK